MNTKKKNILYLLHLPPPVHGSSMVGELIKNSKPINDTFNGRYINLLMSRQVKKSGKPTIGKLMRFPFIWLQLFGKLVRRKPDLCYYALTSSGSAFYRDCVLIGLLRVFGVETIYHFHNKGVKKRENDRLYDLLYKFVFKGAKAILLSERLYFDIEKYVPRQHVYYCPNGIKDYQLKAEILSFNETKPFKILFLSNLLKEKGVRELVDACSILLGKGYDFQCDFVGGEGDVTETELNNLIRQKGLSDNIRYLGPKFGKFKEMAYEQADVFVLPTSYANECFPLVILEAMQHGLPVISTFEGGIPDMVEDGLTGFLIHANDPQALAEKLEILMCDPDLRKKMGVYGRTKYDNNFTIVIFERNLLSILQNSLNN